MVLLSQKIIYPESDGQPMADNTEQFNWIVLIKENLEILFAHDPVVFVAGDLLWYPIQEDNKLHQAPDVLVAFGRPKGKRGSYQQWKEDNIAPQVVFEILSPGNTLKEMAKKLNFYHRYGVQEYYLYDPDKNDLGGWLRIDNNLEVIEEIEGWVSPRLGIRFVMTADILEIYGPDDQKFLSSVQLAQRAQQAEQGQVIERQRAERSEQRAERLAAKLHALGIDPDQS